MLKRYFPTVLVVSKIKSISKPFEGEIEDTHGEPLLLFIVQPLGNHFSSSEVTPGYRSAIENSPRQLHGSYHNST